MFLRAFVELTPIIQGWVQSLGTRKAFRILTSPVGKEWFISESAQRYTRLKVTLLKRRFVYSVFGFISYTLKNSSVSCRKISEKCYNRNHSTPLGMRTRRPVYNHELDGTADLGLSTWFPTGRCYVDTLPIPSSRFQAASGRAGPKRALT